MGILKNFLYCFILILMTGCYETFTPDIDFKPVLCLNSLIKAGEPIEVKVTHTWLYSDIEKLKDHSVDDAILYIYANEVLVDSDYIPKEGDKIKIIAESEKYGVAEAEVNIPYATPIDSLDWEIDLISFNKEDNEDYSMNGSFYFNLIIKITISDLNDSSDYFNISFKDFSYESPEDEIKTADSEEGNNKSTFFAGGYLNYDAEPIFFENIEEMESIYGAATGFNFFTDKSFSGSSYTLKLHFVNCKYYVMSEEWDPELLNFGKTIFLNSVSKSYYDWNYYHSFIESGVMGDISDFGFIDPIWGYSNVSTGAGVVAAQSTISYKVVLKDYFEKFLKSVQQ